jgi:hypothetical protein
MREPSPEVFVAPANHSPLSPTPASVPTTIHNTVVPELQGQAATADEAALDLATQPPVASPHHHPATMDSNPEALEISDTIVVGGDYSDESHDESDESIDYGEGEGGQEQETALPDAAVDDYANTFDSPTAHADQSEAEDAQPDVSMASESMNNPSAPDPAAVLSDHPPPTPTPPTSERADGGSELPSEHPSAAPTASPSSSTTPATASAIEPAEQPLSAASAPDATPTPASADEDDAAAVDIQKLVDDITARAAATSSAPTAPAQAAPVTAPAATAAPAAPAPVSVSLPPSLPPKPSLPNPPASLPAIPPAHFSFQSRGPNAPASPGAPHGSYSAHEGISSLPAPPPGGFNGPPHAHAHHLPLNGDASSGNYQGSSIKQLWDQFQADEKRYTSEAKWERFPEGSRIFIGEFPRGLCSTASSSQ